MREWVAFAVGAALVGLPARALAGDGGVSDGGMGDGGLADAGDDGGFVSTQTQGTVKLAPCDATATRCESGAFTVDRFEKLKPDFDFDSGWLPSSGPVQVRLVVYMHRRTRVAMTGALQASWPEPVTATPTGTRGTGVLAIDDGVFAQLQGHIHVTIAGQTLDWQGPIPSLPSIDLAATNTTTFDPFAWDDQKPAPSVSAITPLNQLFKVPLVNIPLPLSSGGVELQAQALYQASYVTNRIGFDETADASAIPWVTGASPASRWLITSTPGFDTSLWVHGTVTHGMTVDFIPGLYVELLGQTFTLPLLDIPVQLPSQPEPWDFDPVSLHVPLPRIDAPHEIALGDVPIGQRTPAMVPIASTGEAPLTVDPSDPDPFVTLADAQLVIAPSSSEALEAEVTPAALGPLETTITLASNDPLVPSTVVHVTANAVAPGTPTGAASGCACEAGRSAGAPAGVLLAIAGAGALAARRRARRAVAGAGARSRV